MPNEGAFLDHDWQAFEGVFEVQMEIGVIGMSKHGYDVSERALQVAQRQPVMRQQLGDLTGALRRQPHQ
ncbi:hypothetical protein ACXPVS_02585, partial [Pseudomonas sp. Ma2-10]